MKKLLLALLLPIGVLLWTLPVLAGREAVTDAKLDDITAGGDSAAVANDNGPTMHRDQSVFTSDIPQGAQQDTTAPRAQNVAGGVQLPNITIQSRGVPQGFPTSVVGCAGGVGTVFGGACK